MDIECLKLFWDQYSIPAEIVQHILSYCTCDGCNRPVFLRKKTRDYWCPACENRSCKICANKKKKFWCLECKAKSCQNCLAKRTWYLCSNCVSGRCNVCRKGRNNCICTTNKCQCYKTFYQSDCGCNKILSIKVNDNNNQVHTVHKFVERICCDWKVKNFVRRYMIRNLEQLVKIKHQVCGGYCSNRMYCAIE